MNPHFKKPAKVKRCATRIYITRPKSAWETGFCGPGGPENSGFKFQNLKLIHAKNSQTKAGIGLNNYHYVKSLTLGHSSINGKTIALAIINARETERINLDREYYLN